MCYTKSYTSLSPCLQLAGKIWACWPPRLPLCPLTILALSDMVSDSFRKFTPLHAG